MDSYSSEQVTRFFESINSWRRGYNTARLTYLAARAEDRLVIISARIYLAVSNRNQPRKKFTAGNLECGDWNIGESGQTIESIIESLTSPVGLTLPGHGNLIMPVTPDTGISASSPILLHHDGIKAGNRIAVLSIRGAHINSYVQQPETDWKLKAATVPFDNLNELKSEYGLVSGNDLDRSLLEIVALTAIEVLGTSEVKGEVAKIGIWLSQELDVEKVQIGYRVVDKGTVNVRHAKQGNELSWTKNEFANEGSVEIKVPLGAVVQCIASYDGLAHDVKWFVDPNCLQNPRSAILSIVDPSNSLLRNYLFPELPPKGRAADDFEAAISWVLWALGFAPANFGLNNKTRDSFDTVLATPNGDFVVVECTLGLLRAESKLSKLAARVAGLRQVLDNSNMKHIRILPTIITAMTLEQVKVDVEAAKSSGILVLTREDLEWAQTEIMRLPNANNLFEDGLKTIQSYTSQQDLFKNRAFQ